MKPLTDKQKKYLWIVAAVLAVIHFGPRYITGFLPARSRTAQTRPSPIRLAPVPPPPTDPAPSPEAAREAQYLGVWAGHSLMPDQTTCSISLRLVKSAEDPSKITGYESKQCMPTAALQGGRIAKESIPELIRTTAPVSAVLTGVTNKDGITFTVDKTLGEQPGDCGLSGFSVTGFGPGQLQAQWQEGKCDSGQMLLLKRG